MIDDDLFLSDAQAVTATGTTASTNYVDLQAAASNLDVDLELAVAVDTAVTSTGSATVTFILQTSSTTGFSGASTMATTGAIGKATLVAGYEALRLRLPVKGNSSTLLRYARVAYTVGTAALSAGNFNAWLACANDLNNK